jgi:parallel beta-helix repeat protein
MPSFSFCRSLRAAIPLLALAAFQHALATTTCVNNAAGLQAALTAAQTNNQPNYIQVVATAFDYNFVTPLVVQITNGQPLTIEGGYNFGCASPPQAIPDNTILNGTAGTYLSVASNGGGLTLRNLTLTGFKPAAGTNAISIADYGPGDTLHVENVAVLGNGVNGINDDILAVYPSGGLVFDDNLVHDNSNAAATVLVGAQYPGLPVTIANNTIANNQGPGLNFSVYSLGFAALYNNILWNNGIVDLEVANVYSGTPPLALNNTWLNCTGCASLASSSVNNSTANPQLTNTYRLGPASPAVNNGVPLPTIFPLTAYDAAGNQRFVGSAPDQGAYETSTEDRIPRVVTSAADSGANTLRQAILDANASGQPTQIAFDLGTASSCPRFITLASPLPSPTVSVTLVGYDEPGSSLNTATRQGDGEIPFNANICLFLSNASSAANALSVAASAPTNVHLDVKGIGFENFNTAIALSGGSGHQVHGDKFVNDSTLFALPNGIDVQIDGGVADVVGGPLPSDVNLIASSSGTAGVLVTGHGSTGQDNIFHTITNNSIGGDPTGFAPGYGNAGAGIELQNASRNIISGNWIAANSGDGISIDNSQYVLVQSNKIGATIDPGLGNVGAGVHALNGASSNWLGSTDPRFSVGGNDIEANGFAGVWIDVDAGTENQVTGNSIFANRYLAVDLGLLGPSANTGTENSGPNQLLHKPLLTSADMAGGGMMTVRGSIATEAANTHRYITFYGSFHCGEAYEFLGTSVLTAGANGAIALNLNVPAPTLSPAYITATDDDYFAGLTNTSELSNCKKLSPSDDIFNDDFDSF